MADWHDVAPAGEILPGTCTSIEIDGRPIAVVNVGGEFFAFEDVCTHDGGDLAGGDVEGHEIVCPRHGARFDVRTGEALTPPAYEDVLTFPVRIEDGMVQVQNEPD